MMSRCALPLQEEALQVTGKTDPQAAAEAVLNRPNTATEWCVVKMGGEGAVLVTKTGEVHHAPAFKVGV
jgi:sugar/nucleoside kinase (ribokinase family)